MTLVRIFLNDTSTAWYLYMHHHAPKNVDCVWSFQFLDPAAVFGFAASMPVGRTRAFWLISICYIIACNIYTWLFLANVREVQWMSVVQEVPWYAAVQTFYIVHTSAFLLSPICLTIHDVKFWNSKYLLGTCRPWWLHDIHQNTAHFLSLKLWLRNKCRWMLTSGWTVFCGLCSRRGLPLDWCWSHESCCSEAFTLFSTRFPTSMAEAVCRGEPFRWTCRIWYSSRRWSLWS